MDSRPSPPPAETNGDTAVATYNDAPATHDAVEHRLRLRGLPFKATDIEVEMFLRGGQCNVRQGSIVFQSDHSGRPSGTAFVGVVGPQDVAAGLAMTGQYMGSRYVEVYEHHGEVEQVAQGAPRQESGINSVAVGGGHGSNDHVVRLRGIPFQANASDIAQFLSGVAIRPMGVHMVYNHEDRPSGEAFVELMSEPDVDAALRYDKRNLGSRYIEVFPPPPPQFFFKKKTPSIRSSEALPQRCKEDPVGVVGTEGAKEVGRATEEEADTEEVVGMEEDTTVATVVVVVVDITVAVGDTEEVEVTEEEVVVGTVEVEDTTVATERAKVREARTAKGTKAAEKEERKDPPHLAPTSRTLTIRGLLRVPSIVCLVDALF